MLREILYVFEFLRDDFDKITRPLMLHFDKMNGDIWEIILVDDDSALEAAKRSPHPRQKLFGAERLGDVIIGAKLEKEHLVNLIRCSAQNDNRQRRRRLANLPADVASGHLWQFQIQNHQRRGSGAECSETRSAVGGELDCIALGLE